MPSETPVALYLVRCGTTNVVIDELADEDMASAVASFHEAVHGCGTWYERPIPRRP